MTKQFLEEEFKKVQARIDEEKERVYKGESKTILYYPFICGLLTVELNLLFNKMLNTDLDMEKVRKAELVAESVEEKRLVEACKICDNNCDYCRFNCNCSTLVEA